MFKMKPLPVVCLLAEYKIPNHIQCLSLLTCDSLMQDTGKIWVDFSPPLIIFHDSLNFSMYQDKNKL